MINIFVNSETVKYVDSSIDLCLKHQNPSKCCKPCQTTIINELNLHKDIKSYLGGFLSNVTKFPFIIHEEEDDNMEGCFRTFMAFQETDEKLNSGMFYFYECSEEFIFGFLSYLSFEYSSCDEMYQQKYDTRFQYELNEWTAKNNDLKILASYCNDGYFHTYFTSEPEEFQKGWYASQGINLPVCKYNLIEDNKLYPMTFQEVMDNAMT